MSWNVAWSLLFSCFRTQGHFDSEGSLPSICFCRIIRRDKGAMYESSPPEHRSSARQILDVEEIDDESFQVYGSDWSNDLLQTRFGQKLVIVRWRDALCGKRWSLHVLKLAVNEQHLLYFDGVAVVPKGLYPIDLRCLVCDQHDEFIKARENLEAIECMRREEIVAATSIVCGTSGVFMKSNVKGKFTLGAVVGALLIDESSMPEGGEELCKMMGLILGRSREVFFFGDLT